MCTITATNNNTCETGQQECRSILKSTVWISLEDAQGKEKMPCLIL